MDDFAYIWHGLTDQRWFFWTNLDHCGWIGMPTDMITLICKNYLFSELFSPFSFCKCSYLLFYFCCIYPISLTVTGMALKFVTRYTHFSNLFYFYCLQFFASHFLLCCKKKIVGGISKENHDYRFSKESNWSVLN